MTELIKGSLIFKNLPEDFIVEELWGDKVCSVSQKLEELNNSQVNLGKLDLNKRSHFLTCDVEKIDIDHFKLISILAHKLDKFSDEISWAGTKDKSSWTCQKISIYNPNIEKIKKFSFNGIRLKNFKWSKRKINLGDHTSNIFTVILRDADTDSIRILNKIRRAEYIPNFFGDQRFGSLRQENFRIGTLILKEKFEEAVFEYLTAYGTSEEDIVKKAKKKLKDEKNLTLALEYFPKKLRVECQILEHIKNHPNDWIGALRIIGDRILLLMCQSVQSKFFNDILTKMIQQDIIKPGEDISIIGGNSIFSRGTMGRIQKEVLDSYNLEIKDFNVKKLPFLSLNGSRRNAFFKVNVIEVENEKDEVFKGNKKIILKFIINSGSYATTFLEQFFDFR